MVLLGKKHACFNCASKYYDLDKLAAICPKCGADPRDDPSGDQEQDFITHKRTGKRTSSKPTSRKRTNPANYGEGADDEDEDEEDTAFAPNEGFDDIDAVPPDEDDEI